MGGPSAEREVSLQSGQVAAQALRAAGARVSEVEVRGEDFALPADADVAFIALHGTFGEDGRLQRILQERDVAYTGSDPQASARAFDKSVAKAQFRAAGIPTPAYAVLQGTRSGIGGLKPPLVVKPARQGSSVGITIVKSLHQLGPALELARRYDDKWIVEQFVRGRELTVGIFDGKPLPVVEIRTKRAFFDYDAKYTPGGAEEIVPAPLEMLTAARAQMLAQRAHECLGCRDFSRVDLMLDERGEFFVLEVNTIPGMTENSLLPKAARAAGLSMKDVCVRLVELALARRAPAVAVGR